MEAEDLRARITNFQGEAANCMRCREAGLLHVEEDGRWFYPLFHRESNGRSGVLLVAEAPNWEDTFDRTKGRLTCEPNTDPSGQFLHELLASVGLEPEDVLFTNAALCLPARVEGKHPLRAAQSDACRPWLIRLITDVEPRAVVTLGATALMVLGKIEAHELNLKTGTGHLHPWFGRYLLPLYHPGRLGRLTRPEALQRLDMKALLDLPGFPSNRGEANATDNLAAED